MITTLALLCALALPAITVAGYLPPTGNISSTDKFAWSETSGWSNFAPVGGGVTVYPDHLEGFAWGENIGWIKMGSNTSGGAGSYSNASNTNWGVNLSGSTVSGFAWSETAGWIKFNPTGGGVTLDLATGSLNGYAWAENLGWIHFKGTSPAYNVKLNTQTLSVTLAGNGGGSVNSSPSGIACDSTGGCSSAFFKYWPVLLTATQSSGSTFSGWSGDCSGAGTCSVTMDTARNETATFNQQNNAQIGSTPYGTLTNAYSNAISGNTIQAQAMIFTENLVLNKGISFSLQGGYDSSFGSRIGYTTLQGKATLSVTGTKLTVDNLIIK